MLTSLFCPSPVVVQLLVYVCDVVTLTWRHFICRSADIRRPINIYSLLSLPSFLPTERDAKMRFQTGSESSQIQTAGSCTADSQTDLMPKSAKQQLEDYQTCLYSPLTTHRAWPLSISWDFMTVLLNLDSLCWDRNCQVMPRSYTEHIFKLAYIFV